MKSGGKKVASGKAKRVATVFTGAVGCAAAFTPAAHAAYGHQAGLDGKKLTVAQRQGTVHGARPDDSGSIGWTTSCSYHPHWVHIASGTGNLYSICVGFKGTLDFSTDNGAPIKAEYICGGGNYGWYKNAAGKKGYYHQGTTFAHLPVSNIKSIHISGWKGADTCGYV